MGLCWRCLSKLESILSDFSVERLVRNLESKLGMVGIREADREVDGPGAAKEVRSELTCDIMEGAVETSWDALVAVFLLEGCLMEMEELLDTSD